MSRPEDLAHAARPQPLEQHIRAKHQRLAFALRQSFQLEWGHPLQAEQLLGELQGVRQLMLERALELRQVIRLEDLRVLEQLDKLAAFRHLRLPIKNDILPGRVIVVCPRRA